MEENLLNVLRKHINSQKNAKDDLNSDFFAKIGFTENELTNKEKEKLGIGDDFINSWKRLIGDNEITVIFHIRNKRNLIMPESDDVHTYLITRNIKTDEEKKEEYVWSERFTPLVKEELL